MSTPLPLFTESRTCASRAHCELCRDPGPAGEGRRAVWAKSPSFTYSPGMPCPLGLPMGWKPSTPPPLTAKAVLKGAAGLVRAALNLDPVPEEVKAARLATCAACPQWTGTKCTLCGCFTAAKVKLAREACPEGRWPAWTPLSLPASSPPNPAP